MAKRNPLSDSEKRLNNLARSFETKRAQGESVYMEPDDFADLCSWYDNNYQNDMGDEVMDYALSVYPDNAMLLIEQAYRFLDSGDPDQAEMLAEQIEDDMTGDLQILKARLMIEHGEFDKADKYLESFPDDKLDPIIVANMYLDTHFSTKAIKWLQTHGEGMEDEEEYLSILVNAYCNTKRHQEAIQICEKLIDKDPFSAHYWLSLGRCQLAVGEYNKALDACDFAITNDEDLGEAYLTRCNLYVLLGNEKRALENLRQAEKLNAVVPGDMNDFDLTMLLEQQRCEDAIRLMDFYLKYVDLDEDQLLNIHYRLGMCYAFIKWYPKALYYIDLVLEKRPNEDDCLMQKANIYLELDKYDDAIVCLRKAVELKPELKYFCKAMSSISLMNSQFNDFRAYNAMSINPLSEEEIRECIDIVKNNKSASVDELMQALRDKLRK